LVWVGEVGVGLVVYVQDHVEEVGLGDEAEVDRLLPVVGKRSGTMQANTLEEARVVEVAASDLMGVVLEAGEVEVCFAVEDGVHIGVVEVERRDKLVPDDRHNRFRFDHHFRRK